MLIALTLLTAAAGALCPVEAQQQPVDTRQYAVNPPQSAVGVPQLPNQRAYPVDRWGRQVLPRGKGAIVIPDNDEHPRMRFQPYASYQHPYGFYQRFYGGLYQRKHGFYTGKYGYQHRGKKR
jgi:hypothetical protein